MSQGLNAGDDAVEHKGELRFVHWRGMVGRIRSGLSIRVSHGRLTGRWRRTDAMISGLGVAIAGFAIGWCVLASSAPGIEKIPGRFTLAQLLPFERNKVEPLDNRKAFIEGYQAYQRHDYFAAIERMQLVARTMPELADYGLYYLGEAQRENGDKPDAAQSFYQLTQSYPQSVMADAAGLEYARLQLDSGHPEAAIVAAARVSGHSNSASIEEN